MTTVLTHAWNTEAGFHWDDADAPAALKKTLEPLSGLKFAGARGAVDESSIRTVDCTGTTHTVLTRVVALPPLADGRTMRRTRHLIVDQIPAGVLPGQMMHDDSIVPVGGQPDLGDDTTACLVSAPPQVSWDMCGGNWTDTIAARVRAGDAVRVIFPSAHPAMDWWRAIEPAIGSIAWQRWVLLERFPQDAGADVVIAVDGTPCAQAMRSSGRSILDLAADPQPPAQDATQDIATSPAAPAEEPSHAPDVVLTPGGPPVGLMALTGLAVLLVIGAVITIVLALQSGTPAL